jgi:DNA-binding SARP family transcriptional activator
MPVEIRCFGRFTVARAGRPVEDWQRSKACTLLKYVVARRQPVAREILLELLWPDADTRSAANSLRVALHTLRKTLRLGTRPGVRADGLVVLDGGNVRLNPDVPVWIDVDDFAAHFESAFRLERQGGVDEAIAHYEAAEQLYRADYLVEDLYEDWTQVRREELRDQYLLTITRLADECERRGDAVGCIVRCHKILEKDACREDAYQRLMAAYARLGRRSDALRWYDLCARTLQHELDLPPSDRTRQLRQQIFHGTFGLTGGGLVGSILIDKPSPGALVRNE